MLSITIVFIFLPSLFNLYLAKFSFRLLCFGMPISQRQGARQHMAEKFILTHTHTRCHIPDVSRTDSSPAPRTNHKAVLRVFRHFLGVFLLKHGRAISDPNIGLAGLGLGECGKVLCAGDLEYKLDTSGWHMCTWNCTDGQVPNKFKAAFKSDDFQAMSSDDMAEEALRDLIANKYSLKMLWVSLPSSTHSAYC